MVNKMYAWSAIVCGVLTSPLYVAAETAVSGPTKIALYSYSKDTIHYEGITPGMIIGQQNWQIAEKVLPVEIVRILQAGDFTIEVQETTDLPMREAYVFAT